MQMVFWPSRMLGVTQQHSFVLRLSILSPLFQVISLRDQIKRRQQGADGGKDVREGFMPLGCRCFGECLTLTLRMIGSTRHVFTLQH